MNTGRRTLALALGAQLIGAGVTVLCATRSWQSARLERPRPLPPVSLDVTGRTIDALPTALSLVALAGVVAVLASAGVVRRGVGALVALAGLGIVLRALGHFGALSDGRLRSLARSQHNGVLVDATARVQVDRHAVWPVVTVVAGLLIVFAGVLAVVWGPQWSGMSRRYERAKGGGPTAASGGADVAGDDSESAPQRASDSVQLWNSLDRGEDPTSGG